MVCWLVGMASEMASKCFELAAIRRPDARYEKFCIQRVHARLFECAF